MKLGKHRPRYGLYNLFLRTHSSLAVLVILGGLLALGHYPTYGQYYPCSPTDAVCVCSGHQAGELVPDCDDCSGYILCGTGSYQKVKCPPGLIFNVDLKACVPGQCPRLDGTCATLTTVTPPTSPGTQTPPGPGQCASDVVCSFHGQIIAHPEHCRLFYTCVGKCPSLGFCELGKWFDREKFVCDYPFNVHNCPSNKE
ncbi:chitin-binding domain protein cbd-1 [Drosophila biarmipes]|uniref:chitin-binding domain protein cbd-1 n=1 Tax=Drosophila biarmipes TaxID=125945 RepID=UPI0021CC52E3|nr:chitin-binding domain protein cbd-1 [Drosophila biarmipes]